LLDYEADAIRASERFTKELKKLNRDTTSLGGQLEKHGKRMTKSAGKSAQKKQRLANRSGRAIDRSAAFIEKRQELLEAIVKDIKRNTEGFIASRVLDTDEGLAEARELAAVLKEGHHETGTAVESVVG